MRPPASAERSASTPATPRRRERVRTQDLTAQILRDWLDDACCDALIDEDGDVLAVVDTTRVRVRLAVQSGLIFVSCSILLPEHLDQREEVLDAANAVNRSALVVRAVLRGWGDGPYVLYEHEHFALAGVVTRRQFVKLVARVKCAARDFHRDLVELAE